jgi:protein-disulfide isomerase
MDEDSRSPSTARWRARFEVFVMTAMLVASVAVLWAVLSRQARRAPVVGRPAIPATPVSIKGAPTKGSSAAKLVLIMYSDIQCPFCGEFARGVLPEIERRYVARGQLRIVFRELPLNVHPFALQAAEAAVCAQRQGMFWQLHDALFADQGHLDDASILEKAQALHLRLEEFSSCLGTGGLEATEQDVLSARRLGITGTPTFLLGVPEASEAVRVSLVLSGTQPLPRFEAVIDGLLER